MNRNFFSVGFAFAALSACGLSPEQQEAVNREPDPPGTTYLVSQSVQEEGIVCKYSNGYSEIIRNIAAGCPDVR